MQEKAEDARDCLCISPDQSVIQIAAIEIVIDHLINIGPQEAVLLCKPAHHRFLTLVKEIHNYKVPEIIALSIMGGNPDYLEWVEKNVD